ncbi:MAG: patatin-like phospholipase family protein [Candidatus Wolfebacteria bacterium]|nr:patatin-like phospholipase family protein [Candidatus Wolfebacteria bacterium]
MKTEKKKKERKKIGLALGGGGAKGLAHIGVIKVLERAGIEIDYIAGTSMGAVVGGWYAATKDVSFLERSFERFKKKDVTSLTKLLRKKDGALFKDHGAIEALEDELGGKKIENCQIPFKAVAADVTNGNEIIMSKGNLVQAIKASSALPIVFRPVTFGKKLLVDGGLVNPVPADVVKDMGADFVIAVDVSSKWHDVSEESINPFHFYTVIGHALSIMEYQLARHTLEKADLIIKPVVLSFNWLGFEDAKDIIEAGEKEMEKNLTELRERTGHDEPLKTPAQRFFDFIFDGE